MAHFILEYSDNFRPDTLQLAQLFEDLHKTAVGTGLFPLKGIRSRAHACQDFRIADGNPEHGFVHLTVKIGHGRSLEERQRAAKIFFNVLSNHFELDYQTRGLALSFEMVELDAFCKYNQNNLAEKLWH